MDRRTLRAAVVADLFGFVGVGGVAWFMGAEPLVAVLIGLVAGTLLMGLLLAAARRADDTSTTGGIPSGGDDSDPGETT